MSAQSKPDPARRIALYALVVCAFATAAAVVSFVKGSWLGVVWVLLAGLTSNLWWIYLRKVRTERAAAQGGLGGPLPK
ncbi:hypothetical protein [Streptomyces buecherae]|uniref:Uncharacterized protein n=1 Tax=Streptomyces buecherae TaxID=2763006 RepID=A0A7G8KIC2_9ACTN|nr:hypothetical protein [Streptomyces buecherae]MBC3986288.1 hypothetical protein [Streptomyces buecherae]MBC3989504.1 hypothetical protein [Streptomyces buecherae]QKW49583.1 hypothetical protein HUT08_08445 [Streptomyces buecherae]QNJ42805.1 hypothetical protein H7H31_26195 [Streptomyces buecherae]